MGGNWSNKRTQRGNGMDWIDLREDPTNLPTKTVWYVCKVKSSHDLALVYGFEEVTADKFDGYAKVKCPLT